jgi:hypothetical protein
VQNLGHFRPEAGIGFGGQAVRARLLSAAHLISSHIALTYGFENRATTDFKNRQ